MEVICFNDYSKIVGGTERALWTLKSELQRHGIKSKLITSCEISTFDWVNYIGSGLLSFDPLIFANIATNSLINRNTLFHINNIRRLTLAPFLYAKMKNIPRIIDVRDYWPICHKRTLYRYNGKTCSFSSAECLKCIFNVGSRFYWMRNFLPYWWLLKLKLTYIKSLFAGENVVVHSEHVKKKLINSGISAKFTVIPNGIDTGIFSPGQHKHKSPIVLWVGRLTERKGILHFVEIAERLRGKASFIVIGKGPLKPYLAKHNVIALGHLNGKRLADLYSKATVLVSTPLWDEPFGMTIIEAMSCGTPTIAFRSGGITEIIEDGVTGYLVSKRDVNKLEELIQFLIENPKLVSEMSINCRSRALHKFSGKTMGKRYIELYESLFK